MSGGFAFVLDEKGDFPRRVNKEMVELEDLRDPVDQKMVYELVQKHYEYTGSTRGKYVLGHWKELLSKWVKVMPVDYKRALEVMKQEKERMARELEVAHG
jgi:glutamate synthase domain-containing protein 3